MSLSLSDLRQAFFGSSDQELAALQAAADAGVTATSLFGVLTGASKIKPGGAGTASASIYSGTGAPGAITGVANGDFYFRVDGGVLTTIYQRRAGAWVGIV